MVNASISVRSGGRQNRKTWTSTVRCCAESGVAHAAIPMSAPQKEAWRRPVAGATFFTDITYNLEDLETELQAEKVLAAEQALVTPRVVHADTGALAAHEVDPTTE